MLKYPLLKGKENPFYPKDKTCTFCHFKIKRKLIYITGGALLLTKSLKSSIHTKNLQAFLRIGFHGDGCLYKNDLDIPVIEALEGGQFDISFCSTACLRKWFNELVDVLAKD